LKNCRECGKGYRLFRKTDKIDSKGRQVRQCTNCGTEQSEETPPLGQYFNYPKRVFYYDIETSMMTLELETFQLKQYSKWLPWESIKSPPFMICWAGVWIENGKMGKVIGKSVTKTGAKRGNDKACVKALRDEMDRADYIVGHNSKAFDTKKSHLRFILNNIQAPDLTVKQQDTIALAKKYFKNDSNALGYWLHVFGDGAKDRMTKDDWHKCKAGDQRTLDKMLKYCKKDVKKGAGLLKRFDDYLAGGGITLFK